MRWRKRILTALSIFVVLALGFWLWIGRDIYNGYKKGFFDKQVRHAYSGDTKDNLQRIYNALMLYERSEGVFPSSNRWMDAISNRLQTADLKAGEGAKKLIDPTLDGTPGQYGYAMNDAASGKYHADVPGGKDAILVFQSSETARNAHGDPTKLEPQPPRNGVSYAVTVGGKLIEIH